MKRFFLGQFGLSSDFLGCQKSRETRKGHKGGRRKNEKARGVCELLFSTFIHRPIIALRRIKFGFRMLMPHFVDTPVCLNIFLLLLQSGAN